MTSHVEQQVQARIAAARQKAEDNARRRQEFTEARQHGLAARRTQRLTNHARRPLSEEEKTGTVGYIAACLAVLRTGRTLDGAEHMLAAVVPSQADAAEARHIAEGLAALATTPRTTAGQLKGDQLMQTANAAKVSWLDGAEAPGVMTHAAEYELRGGAR
ncbi:hypothetical protein [Streptomyces griseofuscus]|uniref:hypothetical protein n=1 Tax=Streptomyces griseofuscus TaxID=146922 RepID=UPI003452687A